MPVRELISADTIAQAVAGLGQRLSDQYRGRPLTVLAVLSGSIMLVADLMRKISIPHQLGVLHASSYRGATTVAGDLHVQRFGLPDITDRDVLLVDDIFDTGRTLEHLIAALAPCRPRSVQSAVLLWKQERRAVDLSPDYYCFSIPDVFVVGYGLDFDGHYRHLPFIGVVE